MIDTAEETKRAEALIEAALAIVTYDTALRLLREVNAARRHSRAVSGKKK